MKKTEAKQLVINDDQAGQRIDNFLHRYFHQVPRSRVYQMLRKGEVRVNKGRIKQTYKLVAGDQVRLPPMYLQEKNELPQISDTARKKLIESIIYEDNDILALNKPAGLSVHGGSGQALGVIEILRSISVSFEQLELVHRLDKDTSGCLLLAKNRRTLTWLHQDMKHGKIKKNYTALLGGRLDSKQLKVNKPLKKNTLKGGERIVQIDSNGKRAVTLYARRQLFADSTLVDIDLQTGRTHQIRVHSAAIGHPVIGDRKYGDKEINAIYRKHGLKRLFLHASSVELVIPDSDKTLVIKAPMDNELLKTIDKLA